MLFRSVQALGFVLWPHSARAVSAARAAELARRLPAFVSPVLLFVNPTEAEVRQACAQVPSATLYALSPVNGLPVNNLLINGAYYLGTPVDDQKLINNDQLTALIRSRQDGEEVAVTYVRAGKENTVKVKLAKQEALLEQRPIIKAVTQLSGPDKFAVVQANGNVIVGGNFSPAKSIAMSRFNDDAGNVSQTFNYSDATGAIEINLLDGKKKVTVREPDGTVSFSGPYDTEAERKVAPAAIQTRIAAAEARIEIGRAHV